MSAFPSSLQDTRSRSTEELLGVITVFSSDGCFGDVVRWSKQVLDERGIDYTDRLSPEEK